MGASSPELFDSDDAADLVGDVLEAAPDRVVGLLDAALTAVLERDDPYLEVDVVGRALATVGLLLVEREPSLAAGTAYPDEIPEVLRAAGVDLDEDRAARARAVLDRALVAHDNEW